MSSREDADCVGRKREHAAITISVGRSLEFPDVGAQDEWLTAFDTTLGPLDESPIQLELDTYYHFSIHPATPCSSPQPPPPPSPQEARDIRPLVSTAGAGVQSGAWHTVDPIRPSTVVDGLLPPEARPPWENAAVANSRLVSCERLFSSSPRPQGRRPKAGPVPIASDTAHRRRLRSRR